MKETALHWITQHGYAGIFSLLMFGIIGLPVPDEWLLTFSGYLAFNRTLSFGPALLAAFAGSASGITVSYMLGRILDTYVLMRFGWMIHLTPERLAKVHAWFARRGGWTLLIGYFIPGVRHLTGFVAGASEFSYPSFALFAYAGALCWATAFITLGYFLGEKWHLVMASLEETRLLAVGIVVFFAVAYLIYFYLRKRKRLSHA